MKQLYLNMMSSSFILSHIWSSISKKVFRLSRQASRHFTSSLGTFTGLCHAAGDLIMCWNVGMHVLVDKLLKLYLIRC